LYIYTDFLRFPELLQLRLKLRSKCGTLGGTLGKFDNAALAIADELAMKYNFNSDFRDAIIAAYEEAPTC
jgi:hypothetical protein